METELIKINPEFFADAELEPAAHLLRAGELIIFPTETVYGIGGDATNPESARKIYAAKGRPSDNPLIIHISDPQDAAHYAGTSPLYEKLAKAFMPGPLTVILPKKDIIPKEVTGGLDSVAVRCPSHPIANALIRLAGVPVAAPSANISGRPSATDAAAALSDFQGRVPCIIDGGDAQFGLESTIVKLTGPDSLVLLRPGAVTYDALCCVCADVTVSDTVRRMLSADEHPICPGMKYRHYAPAKPLSLLSGTPAQKQKFLDEVSRKESCVILCYDEQAKTLGPMASVLCIGAEKDLAAQGHRLFSALREADALPGGQIYANLPPEDGFGLALYNRLIRAAAHTVITLEE